MVFGEIVALPSLLRGPFLRSIGPEGVVGGQSERHEGERCHIERAVVGVPVSHVGMRTYEAYGEVAVVGEVRLALTLEHTLHDSRDAGAHLPVCELLGQLLLPGQHGQRLQHGQAVGNGAPYDGERAFGRDEALEDHAILLHTLRHDFQTVLSAVAVVAVRADEIGVVGLLGGHHLQTFNVHRLNDEGVVVVEGERGAVAVEAVAHVPFLHLAHGHLDAEGVILATGIHQEGLFHTYEEEPVGVGRIIAAQALQFLDIALLGHVGERLPQGLVATEETLNDVGCVDQRLSATAPPQIVGALGIYGVGVSLDGPLAQLASLLALGRIVVGQGQPGCNAGHESAEAFHVGHLLVAVVPRGRQLEFHILLQRAVGHILEHGGGHLIGQLGPVGTVALPVAQRVGRLLLGLGGQRRYSKRHYERQYEQSFHSFNFQLSTFNFQSSLPLSRSPPP